MGYPRRTIRDWRGGLNTQYTPFALSGGDGSMQFPELSGFFVDKIGRLTARGGQRQVIAPIANHPHGIFRFTSTTKDLLMVADGTAMTSYHFQSPTARNAISLPISGAGQVAFASAYDRLFWSDGVNAPQRWYGVDGSSAVPMGVPAPPFLSRIVANDVPATPGNLISSPPTSTANPYHYKFTYVNADGTESNPSGPSVVGWNFSTGHQLDLTLVPSTDPQVTTQNIYRIGGSSTEYRLLVSLPFNTTTYRDNIADIDLSLIVLSNTHDQPPAGATIMLFHRERLVMAGFPAYPFRVYLSSYQQPEYFPEVAEDLNVDGGYFDVSATRGDDVVGLAELGSTLLIFNQRTTYALFGDSFAEGGSQFTLRKLCNRGAVSRKAIALCGGPVLFLSDDAGVYAISGEGDPQLISNDIARTLQSVQTSDLKNASACFGYQRFFLFIPRAGASPLNFVYDFRTQTWAGLSDRTLAAGEAFYVPDIATHSGEAYMETTADTLYEGAAYKGVVAAFDPNIITSNIPVIWKTPEMEEQEISFTNTAKRLEIEGSYVPWDFEAPVRAKVYAINPGRAPISHTYKLQRTEGKLLACDLHADLCGRRLQVEISGNVKQMEIRSVELHYTADMRKE